MNSGFSSRINSLLTFLGDIKLDEAQDVTTNFNRLFVGKVAHHTPRRSQIDSDELESNTLESASIPGLDTCKPNLVEVLEEGGPSSPVPDGDLVPHDRRSPDSMPLPSCKLVTDSEDKELYGQVGDEDTRDSSESSSDGSLKQYSSLRGLQLDRVRKMAGKEALRRRGREKVKKGQRLVDKASRTRRNSEPPDAESGWGTRIQSDKLGSRHEFPRDPRAHSESSSEYRRYSYDSRQLDQGHFFFDRVGEREDRKPRRLYDRRSDYRRPSSTSPTNERCRDRSSNRRSGIRHRRHYDSSERATERQLKKFNEEKLKVLAHHGLSLEQYEELMRDDTS